MNATLKSRIKFHQDFSLAARLIKYFMRKVSGVPARMSYRDRSALNCRKHDHDLTLSPRHSSTQTMSKAYVQVATHALHQTPHIRSSSQVHTIVPSSILHLGLVRTMPQHRNFSLALPRIELLAFHRSPTKIIKDLLVSKIAARKSHHSPHQCATWCQQNELICFLVFACKHSCVPSEFQLCLICIVVSEQAKNSHVCSNSLL